MEFFFPWLGEVIIAAVGPPDFPFNAENEAVGNYIAFLSSKCQQVEQTCSLSHTLPLPAVHLSILFEAQHFDSVGNYLCIITCLPFNVLSNNSTM